MKAQIKIFSATIGVLLPALGFAFPPGTPMSEFGPAQVSVGAFFDHSGQDLFEEMYPSVLNTTGLSLEYAPWSFIQMGIFGGAGELDVALPESKGTDTSIHSFNTDYNGFGGVSGKLSTPRFASRTTRLVGYGSISAIKSSDAFGNIKTPVILNGGASIQFMAWNKLNFVFGGEFYAWTGEQKSSRGAVEPFGLSQTNGQADLIRGLVGVEYFFKGLNRPFISMAFRPGGNLGWDDKLGIKNASLSISLGAMATLGKARADANVDDFEDEDDSTILDH